MTVRMLSAVSMALFIFLYCSVATAENEDLVACVSGKTIRHDGRVITYKKDMTFLSEIDGRTYTGTWTLDHNPTKSFVCIHYDGGGFECDGIERESAGRCSLNVNGTPYQITK